VAVIDGDRPALANGLESLGYRVVSETWVRETSGVPLDLVHNLEGRLSSVDDGLRFGEGVAEMDTVTIYEPPADLLEDLHGIDPAATQQAVASNAVAFETIENGNRIQGRIALPSDSSKDDLIEAIIRVLELKYDAVERTDETLLVRERAFDPRRARDLGVPEGPAFGKLTSDEPVEVGSETVTPEMVHTERERRYRL
jgi:D-aminoacyl-tRNA deacylase